MKKYLFLVYRYMHVHLKNLALTGGGREGRGKAHHFVSSNRHIFLKFTCTNMTFDGTSSPPPQLLVFCWGFFVHFWLVHLLGFFLAGLLFYFVGCMLKWNEKNSGFNI